VRTPLDELQVSRRLETGPLLRLGWLDRGEGRPTYLGLVVRYLVVDNLSWPILGEDIMAACGQLRGGDPVRLPAKTTSFKRWPEAHIDDAGSDAVRRAWPYWMEPASVEALQLAVDSASRVNSKASADAVETDLDDDETAELMCYVARQWATPIDHATLACLARAIARWSDAPRLPITLDGHGRAAIRLDLTVVRTVGWFTDFHPLALEIDVALPIDQLVASAEVQPRWRPNSGICYGASRYLAPHAIRERLQSGPLPQVAFNVVGTALPRPTGGAGRNRDQQSRARAPAFVDELLGSIRLSESASGERHHVREVVGGIAQRRFGLWWPHRANLHDASTIERLANDVARDLRRIVHRDQVGVG
jgi:hypothetical protein